MEENEYHEILAYVSRKQYPKSVKRGQKSNWRKKCHKFRAKNGKLYYNHQKYGELLVIKGKHDRNALLQATHKTKGKHMGINKTRKQISTTYYWRTIAEDVVNYLKKCEICARVSKQKSQQICAEVFKQKSQQICAEESKQKSQQIQQTFMHESSNNLFIDSLALVNKEQTVDSANKNRWLLDIIGPFQERTHKGNQCIALLINMDTGWVEARPIEKKESTDNISHFIIDTIPRQSFISDLLVVKSICDTDEEFCKRLKNSLEYLFAEKEGIPKLTLIDEIETFHLSQLLEHYCAKYISDFRYFWDMYLDKIIFAYNTFSLKTSSPFKLWYGRDPYIPIIQLPIESMHHSTLHLWQYTSKILQMFKIPVKADDSPIYTEL